MPRPEKSTFNTWLSLTVLAVDVGGVIKAKIKQHSIPALTPERQILVGLDYFAATTLMSIFRKNFFF